MAATNVETFSNPRDESFLEYYENEKELFLDKIINCRNIREFMEVKGIEMPKNITEYFIDTKHNKKNIKMKKIFESIKNDIKNHELMFKKVERSEPYVEVEKTLKKDTFIVKLLRNITCTDFYDQEKIIIEVIREYEERLSESNRIRSELEKIYIGADVFRWYDYCTLTISYWIRPKYYYKIDEWDYHKIANKEFKYQKKPTEYIWE